MPTFQKNYPDGLVQDDENYVSAKAGAHNEKERLTTGTPLV